METEMRRNTKRTDIGTIILHWWLVGTLVTSALTGLRFAVDMPDTAYLRVIEPFLPVDRIWIIHVLSGVSVIALAAAYPIYLAATGLGRRIWLDRARLSALTVGGSARWGAINVILYWLLFSSLLGQVITGVLMHRGFGGAVVEVHLALTWIIAGYAFLHILAHFALGGVRQLVRVVRPSRIPNPAPSPFSTGAAANGSGSLYALLRGAIALSLTTLTGIAVGGGYISYDRMSRDRLQVVKVPKSFGRTLQADLSDPIWRIPPLVVHTNQGANFDGTGATAVEIRALHDGEFITLGLVWDDPTRSLKHSPLIKRADGWHPLFVVPDEQRNALLNVKQKFAKSTVSNFEDTLAEDKLSIMLANIEKPFGPGAFHPGAKPLADKPPSSSGRGLHYTEDGATVNVWVWHADGSRSNRCENNRIGPPAEPSPFQVRRLSPYKGGYVSDPNEATVIDNFSPTLPRDRAVIVRPQRLPTYIQPVRVAANLAELSPDFGDAEISRWWLGEEDSVPYSAELDAQTPIGTIIPGVIAPRPRPPSRRDVYCQAHWAAGRWTLLVKRRLNTGVRDDLAISSNTYIWVAAFDHTFANHTRHIRPIKLEVRQ
jgi:cytochrome b subunit of formate dehydrogenase